MTALGNILAGSRLTAADVQGVAPNAIIKPADESVTSSTALQNDNDLFLTLPASTTWGCICMVDYAGGTTGSSDMQWQWAVPVGTTVTGGYADYFYSGSTLGLSMGAIAANTTYISATNGGAGNVLPLMMMFSVIVGSTAGTLQYKWAQHTSSATATTVKGGSLLSAWQVS